MFETSSGARALWRVLVAAGAGAAALACGSPPADDADETTATTLETVTASPELAPWMGPVVERWSGATGRPWVFAGAVPEDVGASYHVVPGDPPPGYIAFAYGNGRIVVSPEWVRSPMISTVLMHELGHAFRGDHHEGSGVMYYGIGDGRMTSCLTSADLAWACRDFACTDFAAECERPVIDKFDQPGLRGCSHPERPEPLRAPEGP